MKTFIISCFATLTYGALWASSGVGEYLALDYALRQNDDARFGQYVEGALAREPQNPQLLEQSLLHAIYQQDPNQIQKLLDRIDVNDANSAISQLTKIAMHVRNNDFDALVEASQVFDFLDPAIATSFALAESGKVNDAIASLEALGKQTPQLQKLYDYLTANLMVIYNRDYERALEKLDNNGAPLYLTSQSYLNYWALQVLVDPEKAASLLVEAFGEEELWGQELAAVVKSAQAGKLDPTLPIASAQNAYAEYFYFGFDQAADNLSTGILRLFHTLMPVMAPKAQWYHINLLRFFYEGNEYDDVITFAEMLDGEAVSSNDVLLYKFYALIALERKEDARALLGDVPKNLTQKRFYADAYRALGDHEKALQIGDEILELPNMAPSIAARLHYLSAISAQELDDWPRSEMHLRAALALDPEDAEVLNNLGYSLVDREQDIDEGLKFIEEAVSMSQGQAHIIDSLGWAYFKVGRSQDAVTQLELAVSEMAYNPVVNAHMGDAYWKVGRKKEAVYNWKRALQNLEEDLPDITREALEDRLANGLQ